MKVASQPDTCCAVERELWSWADEDRADWLGDRERAELEHWRDAGRRRAFRAGRLLLKRLVADRFPHLATDWRQIEILSLDDRGRSVRPRVLVAGQEQPWSASIAHTPRRVMAALSDEPHVSVGVDLAPIQHFGDGFLATWFTPAEQRALGFAGQGLRAAYWAVKEAAYKACQAGEPFTPARVEVRRTPSGLTCTYRGVDLAGWAQIRTYPTNGHVAAIVTLGVPGDPQRRRAFLLGEASDD